MMRSFFFVEILTKKYQGLFVCLSLFYLTTEQLLLSSQVICGLTLRSWFKDQRELTG